MRIVVRLAAAAAAIALGVGAWTPYDAAAAEPVDLGGQPVDGSTNPASPTVVEAGLWTSSLGPQSQPQHFTYDRQIKDSTVHVGVIGTPVTGGSDGIQIDAQVPTPDDTAPTECDSDYFTTDSTVPQALVGAEVIVGGEDPTDPCRGAGTVTIRVTRYDSSSTGELPYALKIVEEAPVTEPGEPLPEDVELTYDAPAPTDAASTPEGAVSFDDAPVVAPHDGPVTIATEITEGTELLWKVPLTWGEQLVVRGDLAGGVTYEEDPELADVAVYLRIVQPTRDVSALTESDHYSYNVFGEKTARFFAATYPLRYTNRYGDLLPALPGDHWVAVSVEPPAERAPMAVSVELTFALEEVDVAPPTYQDAVLAQGGGDGPDGYSADTPYLVGDGEFAAVASGNPFTPETEDDSWWGPRRYAGLGLGVVSLASCAAGAVWLARTRRVSRSAANR
ncbi:hypothetical protein [Nocardioides antri]|uniref:Uncharacterized protein n=1 Tax=Nocardioides antri TaxID=2607659 RepID=A0A5B1M4V5_9ACTN|nr:hypothetical protein [Nocardioides antri]KAA1427962.1 hypothetical protein F0U47_11205 [Nocardioides antri]